MLDFNVVFLGMQAIIGILADKYKKYLSVGLGGVIASFFEMMFCIFLLKLLYFLKCTDFIHFYIIFSNINVFVRKKSLYKIYIKL